MAQSADAQNKDRSECSRLLLPGVANLERYLNGTHKPFPYPRNVLDKGGQKGRGGGCRLGKGTIVVITQFV